MPYALPTGPLDDWFELVTGDDLRQGDVLPDCVMHTPTSPPTESREQGTGEIPLLRGTFDVMILSQSCDIRRQRLPENEERKLVVLNRVAPLSVACQTNPILRTAYGVESCRRGNTTRSLLLPPAQSGTWGRTEPSVLMFAEIWTVPLGQVRRLSQTRSPRPRLKPPYREWVSQAFGRYFSRVGLESELTEVPVEDAENELIARISALDGPGIQRALEAIRAITP